MLIICSYLLLIELMVVNQVISIIDREVSSSGFGLSCKGLLMMKEADISTTSVEVLSWWLRVKIQQSTTVLPDCTHAHTTPYNLTILKNRVFLWKNYWLIIAVWKFDVLKTNMLVLRTPNFQGVTIRWIVQRHKHSVVFCVHH